MKTKGSVKPAEWLELLADARSAPWEALVRSLEEGYYTPRRLPVAVEVCQPVEGAGIIELSPKF